jgi:hypothetical protein
LICHFVPIRVTHFRTMAVVSTRELKQTLVVACGELASSLRGIEQDLEEIFAFQIVDERTKLLTSVILEARLVRISLLLGFGFSGSRTRSTTPGRSLI